MNFQPDTLPSQRIRTAYFSALLLTAVMGMLIFMAMMSVASEDQTTTDAILVNTEQRMNLQRATLLLTLWTTEPDPAKRSAFYIELNERLDTLETTQTDFAKNHHRLGGLPSEVYALYFDPPTSLSQGLEEFIVTSRLLVSEAQVSQSLTTQSTPGLNFRDPEVQHLLELSLRLCEQYSSVVEVYIQIDEHHATHVRLLAGVVLTGLVLVLSLEGWLIFRPMEQAILQQHASLHAEITQRQQTETALRRSEAVYRILAQHLPDMAVLLFDQNLRFTLAEGPVLTALGFSHEVEGKTLAEVVSPDVLAKLQPRYQRALQGETITLERPFRDHYYYTHFAPVYNENHEVIGGMVTSQDITARKQAETMLRVSESKYRLLTENMADVIWVLDTATLRFNYVSPSVQNLRGYTSEEVMLQRFDEVLIPESLALLQEELPERLKAFMEGDPTTVTQVHEMGQPRKDGSIVWTEVVTTFLKESGSSAGSGGDSGAIQVLGVSRDITERRKFQAMKIEQERLQAALQKEQELSELKSHMMMRIAHEFRTPLAVIQSSTESLEYYHDRLTKEQRTVKSHNIMIQIRRITRMLDDIAIVLNGSFMPKMLWREPVNITALCDEVITKVAGQFPTAIQYSVDQVDDVTVQADRSVLIQALGHILTNAAQFSPPGSKVQIGLRVAKPWVEIIIQDQGIGILPEEHTRVFEPFFRGSNIHELSGLGLGLTIAKAAIEAHHGKIDIRSVTRPGTTVTVSLPS